jgi:hypothetical protein
MAHSWDDPDESTGIYDPTRASIQPADERWFISRDRQAKEQLSAAQIIQLCQDGTVSEATLVWREGLSGWTPLGEVPELAQALRAFSRIPPMPKTGVAFDSAVLPSLPLRGSLPSLPPPPSLPAAARYGNTTTPPQRMSIGGRMPSVIINEGKSPTPLPAGRLLSMLKFPEPYSIQMPGARRVGIWTLVLGASTLLVGTALGAVLFAGEESAKVAAVVELDLDDTSSRASAELPSDLAEGPAQPAAAGGALGSKSVLPRVVEESPAPPLGAPTLASKPEGASESRSGNGTPERKATSKAKAAPSPAVGNGFDAAAANRALASAASRAGRCKPAGGPTGPGQVRVTYAPSGSVKSVNVVTAKFQDTTTGSCLQMVFRSAKVPPFTGDDATVTKGFTIQ